MSALSFQEQLARMIGGFCVSQMIYVAAKLDLATRLATGPKTSRELAEATHTDPGSLYRLLRALASVEIFAETDAGMFSMTPLAEQLRSDLPATQHAMAIMMGEEHYQAYGELLYSVQTGRPSFDKIYGKPVFDYFGEHPEAAKNFDDAMTSIHGRETSQMVEAYDFSGIGTLMDVGGGNGSMLTGVLEANSSLQGILFDLPQVIARAKARIEKSSVADRIQLLEGSFFESIPAGADAYMMRHIIHDWDDERSLKILRNVAKVIKPDGKLLVIDGVVEPGNEPSFTKLLDLTMLTMPGGQERTEEEFRRLFEKAGFMLARIVPTNGDVSIIEGRRA